MADSSLEIDFTRPVPIFPLPEVQLFPHALLPLHVFEPRYRDLVRDAMATGGSQTIAMVTLAPGFETHYDERPQVLPVCGVGRVIAHDSLPDGRSNILLRGVTRARILEELPATAAYRLVRLEPLADRLPADGDCASAQRTLVLLTDQLAVRLPSGTETLRSLARSQTEPGALADVLSAALITQPGERQTLIETLDVALRIELVTQQVGALIARFADHRGPAN